MTLKLPRRAAIAAAFAGSVLHAAPATGRMPPIAAVVFAPDGKSVLAGSQAGVSVRDVESGQQLRHLSTGVENIHHLQFSPDGKSLAVAGGIPAESGVIEFLDWPSGNRRSQLQFGSDLIYGFDYAPNGSRWVSASADEVCAVFDKDAQKPSTRFTKHSRAVLASIFLPDGKTIVSASRDQTLRVWDGQSGQSIRTLHNHSRDVHALALKPLKSGLPMVASASADLTVRFWQPTIGRMVRFIRLPSEPLCIAWLADGEKIIAGCRDGKARLINPVTVQVIDTIEVTDGWLYAAGVHPTNHSEVAFGSTDGRLHVMRI